MAISPKWQTVTWWFEVVFCFLCSRFLPLSNSRFREAVFLYKNRDSHLYTPQGPIQTNGKLHFHYKSKILKHDETDEMDGSMH